MPEYTLQDIDNRVLSLLDENTLFYPQNQRTTAINEAIQVTNLATPFCMATVDVPGFSIKGQQFYPVPAGFIFPIRVYFNGKQLQKVSFRSLTMRYRNWATDLTSMGQPVQEWCPLGLGMFLIHPIDATGGQTISVNGVVEPVPLVNETDSITIEDSWVTTIVNLSFVTLIIKESAAEFAGSSLIYQEVIRDMKSRTKWTKMKWGRYWLLNPQNAATESVP